MYRKVFVILSALIFVQVNAQPPEVEENICLGQEDGVLFGIDGYCSKHYYCEGEYGYLQDCLDYGDFKFDPAIGNCNYAENVECTEADNPENPDQDTEAPDDATQAPLTQSSTANPNTQLVDVACPTNRPGEILFFESADCSEYYICANGVKMTMKCSEGFVFNPDEKQCDHPVYNPRCSNVAFDENKNVKCKRHGFYTAAYPADCTKYVFCAEGVPFVQTCPIGTAWQIDHCVAKQYTQCFDAARVRF